MIQKEEQVAALKRHLTFFNVTPAAVGPVLGVTAAMEEAKANGADIDEGTIGSIKIGLMGPSVELVIQSSGNIKTDHSSDRCILSINRKCIRTSIILLSIQHRTYGSTLLWT